MANGCHLITLRLDTALMDDVGHGGVVSEVILPPRAPPGPAGAPCLELTNQVAVLDGADLDSMPAIHTTKKIHFRDDTCLSQ